MNRGTFTEHEGRPAVRFEHTYDHPIERVWAAVIEPAELAHWFPSAVEMEPRVGGRITFSQDPYTEPTTGRILAFDPPWHLTFTWAGDELHFQLEADGPDRCRFTLINVLEARDTATRNAAGWSVCLGELSKHLEGTPSSGPHSDSASPWRAFYDDYLALGMPSGAPIPESPATKST
jgi:uncharacterized protein YndB with AHSA1/START domain